ncbi:hypothetical protein DPX39_040069000 [Trypanosoma brucei equiperdum]|uniref:Transmembrane protein n=1 Tax=Trypanosoma brucei equiperdum TaxID=630700 RepID=A0A3L6LEA4_9TRYP|nr:hypothetical protein DPX39_040069000 [Trypanosoma brucei equiperdum]
MFRNRFFIKLQSNKGVGHHKFPRRATHHAVSSAKLGKERFDLMESLRRDREEAERNRMLPWRSRLKKLQEYPWKFFIAFMVFWSWLGTYAVPYLKNMRPGELPTVWEGRPIPKELKERATPMPHFRRLSKGIDES